MKPSRRFIGDISHSAFLRNGGMNREKRNNETKPESGWSPHAVSVSAHSSCRDPCGFSCEKGEELFRGLWPVNKGHIVVDEPAEHWGHAAKPAGRPQKTFTINLVASAMNITEPLLLIVGLEIGIFAVVWCAALVLRHFSPRIYAAHICAEVDNTIPQRCFDCSEAACKDCEFYSTIALIPEKTRTGCIAAVHSGDGGVVINKNHQLCPGSRYVT